MFNVGMEQWMYLSDNGTLLVRTTVKKLGIRLTQISEQFVRKPDSTTQPADGAER